MYKVEKVSGSNLAWYRANEDVMFEILWEEASAQFDWGMDNVDKTCEVTYKGIDVTNRFLACVRQNWSPEQIRVDLHVCFPEQFGALK